MNGSVSTYVGRLPVRFAPDARFGLAWTSPARSSLRARSLPALAWRGLRGKPVPGVMYGHDLDRVTVYCDLPMPLQVDGEDLGDVREAHFEAERGAAKVLA